jgi:hypothetical protein
MLNICHGNRRVIYHPVVRGRFNVENVDNVKNVENE